MQKRQFRRYVFQLLFVAQFHQPSQMDEQMELFFQEHEISADTEKNSLKERVGNIIDCQDTIDQKIEQYSNGWALNRIGKAELAILRQAVYEIEEDSEVPDAVAINEAVELAKQYADEKASGFINGILGSIVRAKETADGELL